MSVAPALPLTLQPSRLRLATLLLVSLGLAAMGVSLVSQGKAWPGWSCALFFGVVAAVFAASLLPGANGLRIDDDGFAIRSLFCERRVAWRDVAGFAPVWIGNNRFVGFDYLPDVPERRRIRGFNRAITGIEGILPDRYGMRIETLAGLMNVLLAESNAGHPGRQASGSCA